MKAHTFFAETKRNDETLKEFSQLIGRTVKAIPTNETPEDQNLEQETFTIVGLTFKDDSTSIYAVLKSDECEAVVNVKIDLLNKKRETYFYDPGYILELLE